MSSDTEEKIARLATEQHGVATRAQLVAAGLTPGMVDRRVSKGWLRRLHRGVYGVGPIAGRREREFAAVLACGRGARISHRTAARLLDILPGRDDAAHSGGGPAGASVGVPVEVKVPGDRIVRRPGLRVYRALRLEAEEVATVDRVPVTTPARTLIDLASTMGARDLERVVARAERTGLVDRGALAADLDQLRGRPGIATLAEIIGRDGGPAFTRSVLEDRFLGILRRFRLPAPALNTRVFGHELDCYWAAARLAVELDGRRYHRSWQSQSNDRARDADLAARGIRVIRITWDQLTHELEPTIVRVAQALAVSG